MSAFRLALLNIRADGLRTIMLVFIVAIINATALTLVMLSNSIENTLERATDERGVNLTVSQRNAADLLTGALPIRLGRELATIQGVNGVTGELVAFGTIDNDRQTLILGWDDDAFLWHTVPLAQGRLPSRDAERNEIVIGESLAQTLGKRVGERLLVFDQEFTISGISAYRSTFNRATVVMRLADLQALNFRSGQVSFFHLRFTPAATSAEISSAASQIQALGPYRANAVRELLESDRNFQFFKAVSLAITIVSLLMGTLCVGGVFLMTVAERRRDIAVLLAIGWPNRKIFATVAEEASIVGSIAGVIAVPLVLGATRAFRFLPGIGEILTVTPSASLFALGIALSCGLSIAGAAYPAFKAMHYAPSETISGAR